MQRVTGCVQRVIAGRQRVFARMTGVIEKTPAGLVDPAMLVEIEADAILDEGPEIPQPRATPNRQ